MSCDPYLLDVLVASRFNGTNGSTTFTELKGRTLTANGNAQISTTQSKFGGSSLYLDGTGDYLSFPANAEFSLDGDFTIEAWVRLASPTSSQYIFGSNDNASGYLMVAFNAYSGELDLGRGGVDWPMRFTGFSVSADTWFHFAIVRASGAGKCYINGTQIGAAQASSLAFSSKGTAYIGYQSGGNATNGYINDFRITRKARYLENFTAPTAAIDTSQCSISGTVLDHNAANAARVVRAYRRDTGQLISVAVSSSSTGAYTLNPDVTSNVLVVTHDGTPATVPTPTLALRMGGNTGSTTFTDDASNTITAYGNVAILEGVAPNRSPAACFDGSSDYLSCAYSSNYEVGSGDFTIEMWFFVPNVTGQKTLFAFAADYHYGIFINAARINAFASSNGTSWDIISGDTGNLYGAGTIDITANVWHHLAWVRSGTTWTMYLDGVIDRRITGVSGTVYTRNEALNVGRWGNGSYWMNGRIAGFRIVKGQVLYSAPFAPPAPVFLPAVSTGTYNALAYDMVVPG